MGQGGGGGRDDHRASGFAEGPSCLDGREAIGGVELRVSPTVGISPNLAATGQNKEEEGDNGYGGGLREEGEEEEEKQLSRSSKTCTYAGRSNGSLENRGFVSSARQQGPLNLYMCHTIPTSVKRNKNTRKNSV